MNRTTHITRLLVSVRTAAEAVTALGGGADIIDVKEPRTGVLGAAPLDVTRAIVAVAGGRRPVSATVGDVPLAEAVEAAAATADTGVDYVKIGVFEDGAADLAPFTRLAAGGMRLILVMFADRAPDFGLIARAGQAGFAGLMLDTATKGQGGLRAHSTPPASRTFSPRRAARTCWRGLLDRCGRRMWRRCWRFAPMCSDFAARSARPTHAITI